MPDPDRDTRGIWEVCGSRAVFQENQITRTPALTLPQVPCVSRDPMRTPNAPTHLTAGHQLLFSLSASSPAPPWPSAQGKQTPPLIFLSALWLEPRSPPLAKYQIAAMPHLRIKTDHSERPTKDTHNDAGNSFYWVIKLFTEREARSVSGEEGC